MGTRRRLARGDSGVSVNRINHAAATNADSFGRNHPPANECPVAVVWMNKHDMLAARIDAPGTLLVSLCAGVSATAPSRIHFARFRPL